MNGVVPVTYVHLLFDYLDQQGLDAQATVGDTRPEAEGDSLGRFPVQRWAELLARASEALDDRLLGLRLGKSITPRHFGVLGYVLLACGTLGSALMRMQAYQRLLYDVNPLELRACGSDIELAWGASHGRPGPLVDETAISSLLQFGRDIMGDAGFSATSIHFINVAPSDVTPFEDWFGCPVHFECDETIVRLPASCLATPLRQADPDLISVLEARADDMLAKLPSGSDPLNRTRRVIANKLRQGEPSLAAVAHELHLSERSLHRRLASEGHNFRSLLGQVRASLARDYLRDPRLQLTEIAQLLGYSEQSAFNRSFKRETGVTPLKFRKSVGVRC